MGTRSAVRCSLASQMLTAGTRRTLSYLDAGDEITVTVQGIGSVTNTIGAREAYPKDWARHEPASFRQLSYRKLREARQAEQDKKDGVSRRKGLFGNASVWLVALLAGKSPCTNIQYTHRATQFPSNIGRWQISIIRDSGIGHYTCKTPI